MKTAREFFHAYLAENNAAADILARTRDAVAAFSSKAPKTIFMKCIDGRTHGGEPEGYPPSAVLFCRTDGNKVCLDSSNFWYWNRIDRAVQSARFNTPGTPAIFAAFMHRSKSGLGCAAHKSDNSAALKSIEEQMSKVRATYAESDLFVMGGDTETDTMADTLIFMDGARIDTEDIIQSRNLKAAGDVFCESFIEQPIDDTATAENVGKKTMAEFFSAPDSKIFSDLEIRINMQSFLIRKIIAHARENRDGLRRMVRPDILDSIFSTLDKASVPENIKGALVYQIVWNTAFALHRTAAISRMTEAEKMQHIDHAETLVCYGDGFEILPVNKAVTVTPGRGDDIAVLRVAKAVLDKNRNKRPPGHAPPVHINIEVSARMADWEDFNASAASRVSTMQRNVDHVFKEDVALLATYSYRGENRFYPIRVSKNDPRFVYPEDVASTVNSTAELGNAFLKANEAHYRASFA